MKTESRWWFSSGSTISLSTQQTILLKKVVITSQKIYLFVLVVYLININYRKIKLNIV